MERLDKIAWKKKAADRYRWLMCEVRKGKMKNVSMAENVLQKWKEAWSTNEYSAKCDKALENQKSELGGSGSGVSRHCCGSLL